MFPYLAIILFVESTAAEIFSETVGKVIVTQNTCSVMPHRVWKRLGSSGPKPLGEYPPETIKFLMTWVHTAHGVESRLENMLLKWDEQSICFDRPTTLILKKAADGGSFSDFMNKFSYLEVPEHWVVRKDEDDLESWRNVKIDECSTTNDVTYHCPESAFKDSCTQADLEKCSVRMEINSSEDFFTFSRRLGRSHLVATKALIGTIIRNGNIFDVKPVELPQRIFKITLAKTDMMSIGTSLLKY
ncbi:uncharacterized protein CELE_F56C4.1 [Caenorhabditis elegans]|uniref:Secreted protein n=1 Tax=Caenorhabditis elegans TaxID=6239 RepID=Q20859_CAEEL|nr:Secreted protein [Caenorhabditis elegans]CAA94288.2 Secreted protein [Caenorhabditis elegans]|eukprot:NP_501965.2 Uncharacterized protein CELE_F56C4.1 [Caenorhabditis elegans]